MSDFGVGQKIVVTLKAQRFASEFYEEFVSRRVRIVAGETFSIFDWEMVGFSLWQEVVVTFTA